MLVHHHLQRRSALAAPLAASDHLDGDSLTAFIEGRLSKPESNPIVSHLVDCGLCRRTTASLFQLAAEMGEFGQESASTVHSPSESGRLRRLLESLAARVLPNSDDSAVFAYHSKHEDAESAEAEVETGKADEKLDEESEKKKTN
ncbi:MAG: hypothetical protein WKF84_20220 [Pyrinomonadaceae bacterium]